MTTPAPPSTGPWRFWWWLIARQRGRIAWCAVVSAAWMLSMMLPPYVLQLAIDGGLTTGSRADLFGWAAVLLAVGVAVAMLSIMRHRTMTWVRATAAHRTAEVVHEQAVNLGAARAPTGEVLTIGLGDAWTVGRSLVATGPGVGALVGYVTAAVLLSRIHPMLAVMVLLGVPVLAIVLGPLLSRLRRVAGPYREQQGRVTARIVDMIGGLGVLSGLGGTAHIEGQFTEESRRLQRRGYSVAPTAAILAALGAGLPAVFLAAVMWLSARLAVAGEITIGQVVAVYGYTALLVVPVGMFIESAVEISSALVAAERVSTLLARGPRTGETPAGGLVDDLSGVRVAFGTFQAVVAGKPEEGRDVLERLAGLGEGCVLRPDVLLADNRSYLFAGTVDEVIAGAGVADSALTSAALHVAALDDLPSDGREMISDRARTLSGGQQERLRLARAVAQEPAVLLAVEPTSAVDAHTENLVAQRLRAARQGRTTVGATTSALLLSRTDHVWFLIKGRVVATGPHHELLATHDVYRRLVLRGGDEA
ncbi:MAG: ABC transporter ATP-binding protein/permease [Propionibacteriales bacterium]|nr:ABC transporter ATP-binding protein/permease [Propionibacteriales bacterium]